MTKIGWREALRAVAEDARTRADNSKPLAGGRSDGYEKGRADGAAYAFDVIADEYAYLALQARGPEALAKLREFLERAHKRDLRESRATNRATCLDGGGE